LRFGSESGYFKGEDVVAFYTEDQEGVDFDDYEIIEYQGECITVMNTWDIFRKMRSNPTRF
jgi:hypothetical protein